ncbi:hypothetical protein J4729_06225 [Leisingera sp. HS039]|uniref:hypothetical protein n=1 Tax=Leisingera sp. HS039 TaxID=2818496 RepID=UPI001B3A610B|nr:hypothetical protein [Leisingera sp. HS039]MBQ4824147.1 hypothetical protein [Leisingera sp. HS039]
MTDREEQMAAAYAAIGRYIVEFEQLIHWLRMWAVFSLTMAGLKNQGMAWAIVNSRAMNAQSLLALIQSFMAELELYSKESNPDGTKILDHFYKLVTNCMEERNKIVHGTWHIGWGNEFTTDWSKMDGFKGNPKKTGGGLVENLNTTPGELLEKCEEVERTVLLTQRMYVVTTFPTTTGKIEDNFSFDDGRLVASRPPKSASPTT